MNIDCIIQATSIIVAVLTFIVAHIISRAKDRRTANRETYQRLELASIDLFRFEADHIEAIRPIWEENVPVPDMESAEYIVTMDYVCQILNLFEMAIRLRKERIVPPEVFGSWVIWYYNVANAPHFEQIWNEVMWDYTSDLRLIMHEGVLLKNAETDEDTRLEKFFSHVSNLLKCKDIKSWTNRIQKEKERAAKLQSRPERNVPSLSIDWYKDTTNVSQFADFITDNIDPEYISHGELQAGRAVDREHWNPNLRNILREEISALISGKSSTHSIGRFAVARLPESIVAVMLVEIYNRTYSPYAILHDVVVARSYRGKGIGTQLLSWLEKQLKDEGAERIFIESGIDNMRAHDFFSTNGFKRCSLVMFKDLVK